MFTSYHPIEYTLELLKADHCTWYKFGEEVCPKTGRVHLQGMANAKNNGYWGSLRAKCHVERCVDPIASLAYVVKEGKVHEWGTQPRFPNKKEEEKKEKRKVRDLMDLDQEEWGDMTPSEFNTCQRAMTGYKLFHQEPRELSAPCGVWIYGESGIGKSHWAKE